MYSIKHLLCKIQVKSEIDMFLCIVVALYFIKLIKKKSEVGNCKSPYLLRIGHKFFRWLFISLFFLCNILGLQNEKCEQEGVDL